MKERILALCLKDAAQLFEGHKWKFFEVDEEEKLVKIEVPKGSNESYVIELPYGGNASVLKDIVDSLQVEGFIQQTIRMRCSY
jgi:hypothetical protein